MQWLARISIRRPVFATVLMLLLLVAGGLSYRTLGLDFFPNTDMPVVVVTSLLPGAAAAEIETDVSDKIEGAVNTISGIDELRSTSTEGVSIVVVRFVLEKPLDVATQEVRDKVSQILPQLPKGIDAPVVSKLDPGAVPVLFTALRSNLPRRELSELADKVVRRQIESIDGVGEVSLIGARKRQLNVLLDPVALRAHGVTVGEVQRALASQNLNVPGGSLETGPRDITLRVAGRISSPLELARVIVRQQAGHPLRIADLGRVEDGEERQSSAAQYDGDNTVVLQIKKQSGKNTVAVVDTVLARMSEIRQRLPEGVTLEVVYDNSGVIRTSTHAVLEHLLLGAVLAAIIVLIFLGSGRSTAIAATAIPISIVGTFSVMYLLGFTLNFLTLLALALAVGLVIDDAIVVIENIVRHIEKGRKPLLAAQLATEEIGLAVLATTLALMAVFVPVAFMGGIVGRFLKSFGLTMASAIAVSLFVSFTLTPMLGARWLKPHVAGAQPSRLVRLVDRFYRPIERGYVALLGFAMRHRWVVVLACVAALASMGPVGSRLRGGFLPSNDKAQYQVSLRTPEGTSVEETLLVAERMASDIKQQPGVEHTLITVGADDAKTANLALIRVLLVDPDKRAASQIELMQRARVELVPRMGKELRISVGEVSDFGSSVTASGSIQYALSGPDLDELARLAESLTAALRSVPGAVDVDNSLIVGKPELRVNIDRERAADLGISVADIASSLQLFVGGLKISTYAELGQQYDIEARALPEYRADAAMLQLLGVPSTKLGIAPLSSVVTFVPATGPARVERLGRARTVTISASSDPNVGDAAVQRAFEQLVAAQPLPAGYHLEAAGMTRESARMSSAFGLAFGLSFLLMYFVLAAQFESWLEPLVILMALPLTVPFGLLSLYLFGQSINMFSLLGLLVLFGVVQKNAVLQIDHTKQLMAAGMPRYEAILAANRDRLRPILMTTLAFVAGMVPLLLSRGIGAGFNQAMSGIVVGGQALSLLLTLLATPVIFSLADDLARWVRRHLRQAPDAADGGESALAAPPDGARLASDHPAAAH